MDLVGQLRVAGLKTLGAAWSVAGVLALLSLRAPG